MKHKTTNPFRAVVVCCLTLALSGCATTKNPEQKSVSENEVRLQQVTGIGGVFFKVRDPKRMDAWYRENLGIETKGGFTDFAWREKDHPEKIGRTVWSIFPTNSTHFGNSLSPLMINYRVSNLDKMLEQLRRGGVNIEKVSDYSYGRFAWLTDPEGNRIELWEPKEE